jgi:hypothetical protein
MQKYTGNSQPKGRFAKLQATYSQKYNRVPKEQGREIW